MASMQDSGGLEVDAPRGSVVVSGLNSSKTVDHLKTVESSGESEKLSIQGKNEMDPYRELELYLAKVNEEIGEIIESAPTTPLSIIEEPKYPTQSIVQAPNRTGDLPNTNLLPAKAYILRRQNSLGRKPTIAGEDIGDWSNSILAEFNTIIANELNELTKESSQKKKKEPERKRSKEDARVIQYKELLSEFGISDSESSCEGSCEGPSLANYRHSKEARSRRNGKLFVDLPKQQILLNSDYDYPDDRLPCTENARRKSGSLPENLQDLIVRRGRYQDGDANSDYDEPDNFAAMGLLKNQRAAEIDRNTSSLPSKLGHERDHSYEIPKRTLEISAKSNEERVPGERVSRLNAYIKKEQGKVLGESNAKLPPRQRADRKGSLPINLLSQRRKRPSHPRLQRFRRPDEQEAMEPDYDDVFGANDDDQLARSRSLDSRVPRSAPVTPTEEKRAPFSKLLRKRHTPVCQGNVGDVVLVSVSSLPEQDLLRLEDEGTRDPQGKGSRMNSKESLSKKRAVSPLTLPSDISAKRLSESDKDIRQISPVSLKKFTLSRSRGNDVGVSCDLRVDENEESNGSLDSARFEGVENDSKTAGDEHNSRSGSLPISLHSLLSRFRNGSTSCCPNSPPADSFTCSDMATQTSPAISRSSSFTWVSDCESPQAGSHMDSQSLQDESTLDPGSPQDTVDDDNRSSSSSQDLLQSMDEISSGSLSPDTTDRASPLESGIGTASPPRSTDRRIAKPSTSAKCHRKETWERIRRRPSKLNSRGDKHSQDVWIKRESVHTQTKETEDQYILQDAVDSSSGLDDSLPRIKPLRPTNLPLCLSTTASSSLSSGELLEIPPRAPSSPSAASLQLKPEPLAVEMGGKSSSAPLLENDAEKSNGKVPSLQQPARSQSERQLSGCWASREDQARVSWAESSTGGKSVRTGRLRWLCPGVGVPTTAAAAACGGGNGSAGKPVPAITGTAALSHSSPGVLHADPRYAATPSPPTRVARAVRRDWSIEIP